MLLKKAGRPARVPRKRGAGNAPAPGRYRAERAARASAAATSSGAPRAAAGGAAPLPQGPRRRHLGCVLCEQGVCSEVRHPLLRPRPRPQLACRRRARRRAALPAGDPAAGPRLRGYAGALWRRPVRGRVCRRRGRRGAPLRLPEFHGDVVVAYHERLSARGGGGVGWGTERDATL
jgi:hypothetical protein